MHVSFRKVGCAAFVSAALVVGSSVVGDGQAFAFGSPGMAALTASSPVSFAAGTANQPANSVSLLFTDSSTAHVWSAGDRITFQLWDSTTNAPLSNTSSNALDGAAFATAPSVTATNGVSSSAYTVALQQSATSTVNDEFTLTFNQDAPEDTSTTGFTVSVLALTLGANVSLGHSVGIKATASNGAPFTGSTATKTVILGSIPSVTVTNSQVATGGPSATGVALGNVLLRDVAGGAVSSGDEIDLTLAYGAKFTTAGTVDGTLVATAAPTIATVTTANDTVKTTAVKTSAAGDALALSGAVITLPATATEVYLAISDKTTSVFLGAVGVATVVTQARLGGTDRYATATQLYDPQFSFATSVVLTSGANYPHAVSAGYLAK